MDVPHFDEPVLQQTTEFSLQSCLDDVSNARVDLARRASFDAGLTVYRVGRAINELRFQLQLAAVSARETDHNRINLLFETLEHWLNQIPELSNVGQPANALVRELQRETIGEEFLEWFSEDLYMFWGDVLRYLDDEYRDDHQTIDELFRRCREPEPRIDNLVLRLKNVSTYDDREQLSLGIQADRMLHPLVENWVFVVAPAPATDERNLAPFVFHYRPEWVHHERISLFKKLVEEWEIRDDLDFWDELASVEILRSLENRLIEVENRKNQTESTGVDTTGIDGLNDHGRQVWEDTPVGLSFNERQLRVRSTSGAEEAEIKSMLTFSVMRHIARNESNPTSAKELHEKWKEYGGRGDGSFSLNPRLTHVRNILTRLGFELRNQTKIGWNIVRRQTAPAN
jgi:hypothetical protein